MKKKLFIVFASIMLLFSCSKDKDENGSAEPGQLSVYRTGNRTYDILLDRTSRTEQQGLKVLTSEPADPNARPVAIHFWFNTWPGVSREFTPVEFLNDRQLADDEVGITIDFPEKDTLYSTGLKYVGYAPDPADPIQVTVHDGKLSVNIPSMSAYSIGTGIDSATFKGSFSE